MTHQQALQQQWVIAAHRIAFSRELMKDTGKGGNCECDACLEHLEAMEVGNAAT